MPLWAISHESVAENIQKAVLIGEMLQQLCPVVKGSFSNNEKVYYQDNAVNQNVLHCNDVFSTRKMWRQMEQVFFFWMNSCFSKTCITILSVHLELIRYEATVRQSVRQISVLHNV